MAMKSHKSAPEFIRVAPSIPVPYFGDIDACIKSPLKIVTVGINPSLKEFPKENPFQRFPTYLEYGDNFLDKSLNEYFEKSPYAKWFSFYEAALSGFNASYYGKKINTAIHTDLLSSVATNPTWSKLSVKNKIRLESEGVCIWHSLMKIIDPHIIFASISEKYINKILFEGIGDLTSIYSFDKKENYPIKHTKIIINDKGGKTDLIFCRAAQVPLGYLKGTEKESMASELLKTKALCNWK